MNWFSRHLDSASLGAAALGDAVDPRVAAHLWSCARCRREHDRIAAVLDQAWNGADDAVDAAFGPAGHDAAAGLRRARIAHNVAVFHRLRRPA